MSNKTRIINILEILNKYTDEDHDISTKEIEDMLRENYQTDSNRKTLYNDINTLIEAGYDIEVIKSTQNRYKMLSRTFELNEIQIIVSALQTAKCIPTKLTDDLTNKFYTLISDNQANDLKRNSAVKVNNKHTNKNVLDSLEKIIYAMKEKKQVAYDYFKFDVNKNKTTESRCVSPYDLVFNDGFYYMIGYDETREAFRTFRLDRMENTKVDFDKALFETEYNSNIHISKEFNMFSGTTTKNVELKVHNDMVNAMLDKFGESTIIQSIDNQHFKMVIKAGFDGAATDEMFYAFAASYGDKLEIVSPQEVRDGFKQYIKKITNLYN